MVYTIKTGYLIQELKILQTVKQNSGYQEIMFFDRKIHFEILQFARDLKV